MGRGLSRFCPGSVPVPFHVRGDFVALPFRWRPAAIPLLFRFYPASVPLPWRRHGAFIIVAAKTLVKEPGAF
jgi:hypothetical protein